MRREYDFSKGKRGPIATAPGKTRITIRPPARMQHGRVVATAERVADLLDDDVVDWFKEQVDAAGGGNYQTLINQALREYMSQKPLEDVVRRVVREELKRAS